MQGGAVHLRQCAVLDRKLRAESQARSIFDPEIRRLRTELRGECEAALLADYRLSLKHGVEQLLWKAVFYRPIEDFRRRIKTAEGDLRDKTQLAFFAYLEDAKAFYLQLALKLQQRLGDAGFPHALAAQQLAAMQREVPEVPPAPAPQDCRASVHRCLVCLGDLCRYQANSLPPAQRDWAQCRHSYWLACRVFPEGGNAYNQLAVLATYEGDDLAAAFYYCRALATAAPFPVARENLVTHFEQNRAANEKLGAAGGGGRGGGRGGGPPLGQRPASQALKELRVRYTRLLGMLGTRADLDAFPDQLAAAMADLQDNLQRWRHLGRRGAAAAAADLQQPHTLVQLAAATIYAAHISVLPGSGTGEQAAGSSFTTVLLLQRVRGLALHLLFALTAALAAAAVAVAGAAGGRGLHGTVAGALLLPPLRLLLRWLAGAGPGVLLPPPQQQQESADLAAARLQLWQAAAQLATALQELQAAAPAEAAGPAAAPAPVLPEDAYLAGFLPLSLPGTPAAAAAAADAAVGEEEDAEAVAAERVRRMLQDAAVIAAVLSRGGGASAGAPRASPLAAAQGAFVLAALPAREQQQPQQQQQLQQQQPAAEVVEEEEEQEEEVILYAPRPMTSPQQVVAPPPQVHGAPQRPQERALSPPQPTAPAATATATAVQAAAARGGDVEMMDALVAQTAEAVAGSVLPEGDRRPSPPPPLPHSLGGAAAGAAAANGDVAAAAPDPAAAAQAQPAGGAPLQLPPSFLTLLGSPPQPRPQQLGLSAAATAAAAPAGVPLQPQMQQAAGLRALLFRGSQPAAAAQQPQQQAAAAPGVAGGALLSGASPTDRWVWMGAFGTAGAKAPAQPPVTAAGPHLPVPIPLKPEAAPGAPPPAQ